MIKDPCTELTYRGIGASIAVAEEVFGNFEKLPPARRVPQQIGIGHGELFAGGDGQRGTYVQSLLVVEVVSSVRHAAMILQRARRINTA